MNTTTETNSPLTPIQALHRCLEWFTLHHPTAVLPGTKLTAMQELQSVIVAEELRNEPPRHENYTLTLDDIKGCVAFKGFAGDAMRGMIDLWYKIEIKNGASEADALQATLDKFASKLLEMAKSEENKDLGIEFLDSLCDNAAGLIEWQQTENAKLLEVLEIARRYANTEYGESAACRVIASEIQKVFPAHGQEAQNPTI